jgi:alkanesulfonate monooxygenase SsuD/methylene tetrahydromethanopterin reductase-like flavin-dependent oxidoreductase (luciferase family)
MKIGIGLPASLPRVRVDLIQEWARQADAGPFSSLGLIDRVAYDNYEPLVTLAAVAGSTRRIRLMTTVLLTPLRKAGILAKQCATLDVLSRGRLTVGVGIGAREDDFRGAPADYDTREKRFNEQMELMTRVWAGKPVSDEVGHIGPQPVQAGGPELLGGFLPSSMHYLQRWGQGFVSGSTPPEQTGQEFRMVEKIWHEAERPGHPRLVACFYYALGPQAEEGVASCMRSFYAFKGEAQVQKMISRFPTTPAALRTAIQQFVDIGADELMLWPCIPALDQVQRLADLLPVSSSSHEKVALQ